MPVKYRHNFTRTTKVLAFERQKGTCAVCGSDFVGEMLEDFGHHIVPSQCIIKGNREDKILRGPDNCAMLCDTCHYVVHDSGRWVEGSVAPPDYYNCSHGPKETDKESLIRQQWLARIKSEWIQKLGRLTD